MSAESSALEILNQPGWRQLPSERLTKLLNDRDQTMRYILALEGAVGLARTLRAREERFFQAVNELDPDLCGEALRKAGP